MADKKDYKCGDPSCNRCDVTNEAVQLAQKMGDLLMGKSFEVCLMATGMFTSFLLDKSGVPKELYVQTIRPREERATPVPTSVTVHLPPIDPSSAN